jgi:hypothetical protein
MSAFPQLLVDALAFGADFRACRWRLGHEEDLAAQRNRVLAVDYRFEDLSAPNVMEHFAVVGPGAIVGFGVGVGPQERPSREPSLIGSTR